MRPVSTDLSPRYYCLSLLLLSAFLLPFQGWGQTALSGAATRQLQQLVEFNEVYAGAHSGFVLYDLDYQLHLYGFNADRRFVPASNVKLVTFYVANRLLGHRTPAVLYREYADCYELWGTGYPLTLHPAFGAYDELYPWLARRTRPLVLHFPGADEAVPRYGAGWSWDDYNDGYVYEQSALPLYGNRLFLNLSPVDSLGRQSLIGSPPGVAGALSYDPAQRSLLRRSEYGNNFSVGDRFYDYRGFPLERPLHLSPEFVTNELAAALPQLSVTGDRQAYPPPGTATLLEASLPDTVYRRLLQDSDNFLAEQLLLQAATKRYGYPTKRRLLLHARDTLLPALGVEDVRWVDGSGLSRYNLITPRQLTRVLAALDQEAGRERLLSLLPAGGHSGTLAGRFSDAEEPWIWAKTGSLSGVTCLTGLLLTRRGKWLAFSFMHNNFTGGSRRYHQEMERTLKWCRDNL